MSDLNYRSKYLLDLFVQFIPKNYSILEVGSGDGRNVRWLKTAGYENVEGIDKATGSSIEDVLEKEYDVVFTMSTLFLIPVENEWVFEKIARMAKKYIFTVEGETTKGEVIGRNYGEIFSKLGFEEIFKEENVFNMYGVARILKRV